MTATVAVLLYSGQIQTNILLHQQLLCQFSFKLNVDSNYVSDGAIVNLNMAEMRFQIKLQ